jgi:hypothetical protein
MDFIGDVVVVAGKRRGVDHSRRGTRLSRHFLRADGALTDN